MQRYDDFDFIVPCALKWFIILIEIVGHAHSYKKPLPWPPYFGNVLFSMILLRTHK
jgi:hypothetical protein